MSLLNIVKKEVKELLTPATILPVILMFIIFAGLGNFFGEAKEKSQAIPKIGLACHDNGEMADILVKIIEKNCEIVTRNGSIEAVSYTHLTLPTKA